MKSKNLTHSKLVGAAFLGLLVIIPLQLGSGFRYALIIATIILTVTGCIFSGGVPARQGLKDLINRAAVHPLRWPLLALFICTTFSLWMSPDFRYSLRVWRSEIVLNYLLYLTVSLFTWSYGARIDWFVHIRRANIVFLLLYLGLLLQWLLFPQSPIFIQPEYSLDGCSLQDIIFRYGQINDAFTGIQHVSVYLLLFLAVTSLDVAKDQERIKNLLVFLLNLAVLITTTKRAPILALILGLGLTPLFYVSARKYFLIGTALICIILMFIVSTNLRPHLIRGDWRFIASGDFLAGKKDIQSSVSLRIHTYKNFLEYTVKQPFKGVGLGRRNIKRLMPDVIERAGLVHGHNVFLNYAVQTGIQGAVALLLLVILQIRLFWVAWRQAVRHSATDLMALSLVFLSMFWIANCFTDAFRHGSATLYWLVMAVPTGIALAVREEAPPSVRFSSISPATSNTS